MKNKLFETLIVEDDIDTLNSLIRELAEYDKIIKVTAIAKSYADARKIVLTQTFDLSILDKNLDEGYTCFDLINNSNIENFGIIALNSQSASFSIDILGLFKELPTYILKPYLTSTVGDFIKRLNEIKIENKKEKVFLDAGHQGIIPVDEDSIMYIEAEGGCSVYHFSKSYDSKLKITISENLGDQENKLDRKKFLRVHKSFIVNTEKIIKFQKGDTRTSGKLLLENNSIIDYSLVNYEKIKELMKNIK